MNRTKTSATPRAKTKANWQPLRFSLHRACKPQDCELCGKHIPARRLPDFAEYWRIKGGTSGTPRVICCVCHVLFGLPDDGWEVHADGRQVMCASVPSRLPVANAAHEGDGLGQKLERAAA